MPSVAWLCQAVQCMNPFQASGCCLTRQSFVKGGFEKTRTELVERPWAIDNLDQVLQRWQQKPHHKAMLFVDNAGTDVVLGEQQHAALVVSSCSSVVIGLMTWHTHAAGMSLNILPRVRPYPMRRHRLLCLSICL